MVVGDETGVRAACDARADGDWVVGYGLPYAVFRKAPAMDSSSAMHWSWCASERSMAATSGPVSIRCLRGALQPLTDDLVVAFGAISASGVPDTDDRQAPLCSLLALLGTGGAEFGSEATSESRRRAWSGVRRSTRWWRSS